MEVGTPLVGKAKGSHAHVDLDVVRGWRVEVGTPLVGKAKGSHAHVDLDVVCVEGCVCGGGGCVDGRWMRGGSVTCGRRPDPPQVQPGINYRAHVTIL